MLTTSRLGVRWIAAIAVAGLLVGGAEIATAPNSYSRPVSLPVAPDQPAIAGMSWVASAPIPDSSRPATPFRPARVLPTGTFRVDISGAGRHPIGSTGISLAQTGPGKTNQGSRPPLSVTVLSDRQVEALGLSGLVLRVSSTVPGVAVPAVSAQLDSATLAGLFGDAYASRAQWHTLADPEAERVAVPQWGLARSISTPRAVTPSPAAARGQTTVLLAAMAGPASTVGAGDFGATPLSPASSWQVSAQTGTFAWSYPLSAPPTAAGPSPALALAYDSGSVDGETGSTNNQPSEIGEGWSLAGGGAIDRSYVPCASDDNRAGPKTGDLCWGKDNASISFAGHSGLLIRDAASGVWKLQSDDGSTVKYVDPTNGGSRAGDYWQVTTPDGTQYFFGRGSAPAGPTNSRWAVPVYGNDTGEPCHQASYAASSCAQAWRWNLDEVVDPHGNAEALYYSTQANKYAQNNGQPNAATGAPLIGSYTRGGTLDRIDYGLRAADRSVPPSQQVLFDYADRCVAGAAACDAAKPVNWPNWPDTPWDQNCGTATCANQTSPTFWNQKMLSGLRTRIANRAADVDSWSLTHTLPDPDGNPNDGTTGALWLTGVTHNGLRDPAGAPLSTTFDKVALQNRIAAPRKPDGTVDALVTFAKYRVSAITSETGAVTTVTYDNPADPQGCGPLTPNGTPRLPTDASANKQLCFQQWWTPPGVAGWTAPPESDWFHKYVVTAVSADPGRGTGAQQAQETTYDYSVGLPAWRYQNSPIVPPDKRTWSVWAGFSKVQVLTGLAAGDAPQQAVMYTFYQGLKGDRTTAGGARVAAVTTAPATTVSGVQYRAATSVGDDLWLAGRVRETRTTLGRNGSEVSDVITDPFASPVTANDGLNQARFVGDATMTSQVALHGDGGPAVTGARSTRASNTYDSRFRLTAVNDLGDLATAADDRCSTTSYPAAVVNGLLSYPTEVRVVGVSCGTAPSYPKDAISDLRSSYDQQAWGAAPTKGDVSASAVVRDYDAAHAPIWLPLTTATFDALGRVLSTTDSRTGTARVTATAYTPVGSGPVTRTVTTNPLGWKTTTDLDPAWGAPLQVTDPNGRVTKANYDSLGRRVAVWLPERDKSATPSISYGYQLSRTAPVLVSTTTLTPSGATVTGKALYDGLLRPRQTQSPAEGGGAVITDTNYYATGAVSVVTEPYYTNVAIASGAWFADLNAEQVPRTETLYDAAGRKAVDKFWLWDVANKHAVTHSTTAYSYGGDHVTVTPPTGADPTTTITDARGQTTKLIQYLGPNPAAAGVASQSTTYGYDIRGAMSSMTDPARNTWSWTTDLLGRQVSATDPDAGTTTSTYDNAGRLSSTVDARKSKLMYGYDPLDRKVSESAVTAGGSALQATWSFDSLAKGQLDGSTRYVGSSPGANGTPYITKVTGYDAAYRATGTQTIIPAAQGKLAGTYSTGVFYNPDGSLANQVEVSGGALAGTSLASETLHYRYTALGNLLALNSGATSYIARAQYTHLGLVSQETQGFGTLINKSYVYEAGTNRLLSSVTVKGTAAGYSVISNKALSYDPAGDVLKVADTVPAGGYPTTQSAADTQCFGYDQLQQLTSAWTPASGDCAGGAGASPIGGAAPYSHTYGYDVATGNRKSMATRAADGSVTTDSYAYGAKDPVTGAVKPHAVSAVSHSSGAAASSFSYDAAGSTLSRPGQALTYDAEGRLASVSAGGQSQSRVYSADGSLLVQSDPVGGSTLYLGDTEVRVSAGAVVSALRTYSALGGPQAERTAVAGQAGSSLVFLDGDGQGTSSATVDAVTGAVGHRYSDPFGAPRGAASGLAPAHGFLNAPKDPFSGLTHLGAREYDPAMGKFTSVDPVLDPSDPLQVNGYAYAGSNPVSSSDPSGLCPPDKCGGGEAKGGASGAVASVTAPAPGSSVYANYTSASDGGMTQEQSNQRPAPSCDRGCQLNFNYKYGGNCHSTNIGLCMAMVADQRAAVRDFQDGVAEQAAFERATDPCSYSLWCSGRRAVGQVTGVTGCMHHNLIDCAGLLPAGKFAKGAELAVDGTKLALRGKRAAETAGKIPWNSYADYAKVTKDGREYAQVGDRLYTQHAVDRLQPSGLGAPAGATGAGRSISPNFVEDVIRTGTPSESVVNGVSRTIYRSGSVEVVTEGGGRIVVTVNPFSGGG